MALFLTKIFRDEEQHWCWVSFGSSWDADSEYVVYYLIPRTSCRISRLNVKSKAKMAFFETKIVRDEEQHWCWCSFCSSWAADSEYVVHYLIPWTSCRISRLKVKSKAKMALFWTKIFRDEEQHWCWVSFCSSWDADSEYVVHYMIPWTSCRISRSKVKSKAKMALFRDEEQHWCWCSFCSSWDADSDYVVRFCNFWLKNLKIRPFMLIYLLKGPNTKTSSNLKKPNEVGIHFVRLELLNPPM